MPNFLMTMGSHTSLGHNSMITMMECQTNFIVSFIKQVSKDERRSSFVSSLILKKEASAGPRPSHTQMRKANAAVATLKPELEDAFMQEMTRRLDRSVWQAGSCDSYYITGLEGDKTRPASDLTWPGTVVEVWLKGLCTL